MLASAELETSAKGRNAVFAFRLIPHQIFVPGSTQNLRANSEAKRDVHEVSA